MKVAVFESLCGGMGLIGGAPLPASFVAEGLAMLRAVCESFLRAPAAVVTAVVDGRVVDPRSVSRQSLHVVDLQMPLRDTKGRGHLCQRWIEIAAQHDASLIIAPECDGELAEIVGQFVDAGIRTLNCSPEFISFAGDKLAVAEFCRSHRLPHPPTIRADAFLAQPDLLGLGPLVIKPRDGAGCLGLRRFNTASDTTEHLVRAIGDRATDWIVQGWVEGTAVSRAAVASPGKVQLQPWRQQHFETIPEGEDTSGSYSYAGSSARKDLPDPLADDMIRNLLARGPGVAFGWVGFDFVVATSSDGAVVTLIEVNPRLTTSFADVQAENQASLLAPLLSSR